MNYLLDLLQGLGIAVAAGASPFLPLAIASAAGLLTLSTNYEGTTFAFLGSPVVLGLALVLAIAGFLLRDKTEKAPADSIIFGIGILVGAVATAAGIADHSSTWWPGLIAGAGAAFIGGGGLRALVARTRARLDKSAQLTFAALTVLAAALLAAASLLVPGLGAIAVAAGVWIWFGGRRQQTRKYEGLRILR